MVTVNPESREYPLFNSVNRHIREARQAERISPNTKWNVTALVENLIRQAPNRLYFAPDGRFCWVLMFSEDGLRYQARIEILQILDNNPELVKGESFIAVNSKALEQEITWWRRQFSMSGDLIEEPITILQSQSYEREFVHLAGSDLDPFYYRYNIGMIGPRLLVIGRGTDYRLREGEVFTRIPGLPREILDYSNPFPVNR